MIEPDSEEFKRLEKLETEGYESAKQIRKGILQEVCSCLETLLQSVNHFLDAYEGGVLHDENPEGCHLSVIC